MSLKLAPPVIQIALDYPTIEEALAMAEIGIKAGVDWLEVGTPLIVAQGAGTIGNVPGQVVELLSTKGAAT